MVQHVFPAEILLLHPRTPIREHIVGDMARSYDELAHRFV